MLYTLSYTIGQSYILPMQIQKTLILEMLPAKATCNLQLKETSRPQWLCQMYSQDPNKTLKDPTKKKKMKFVKKLLETAML